MFELIRVKRSFDIEGFYTAIKFDWSDSFVFNGESHNFWEVVFVQSGIVDVTEDEKTYTLGENNIIFHAPMEFHRIRSSKGSSPKGFIFSFEATGDIPDILRSGIFSMDIQQRRLFDELREETYNFVHNDRSAEAGAKASSLLKLFLLKMAEAPITVPSSTSQSALEYQRVISLMAAAVNENLTLDDIAKRNHISVSYLKYLFDVYAGIGPKKFFNMLRIKAADELLNKGLSVTEVSIIMNFSSPNYFSVFYKRYTGMPPSQQNASGKNRQASLVDRN